MPQPRPKGRTPSCIHQMTEDDMLDHDQMTAPQFQADTDQAPGAPDERPTAQACAAPRLDAMLLMPFQIAMALPAAVIAESNASSILRHLAWQRARARR